MAYTLPNGSTIDLASSYSAEVEIESISNTNPAVVTATGHGFAEGDIVHLVTGWELLTNRSFLVGAVTTDTFTLVGSQVDTTDTTFYPLGGGVGTVKSVETWVNVPQITNVEFSGAEQAFLDVQFLSSRNQIQIPTTRSAATMTLTIADDPAQPFVPVVQAYDFDLSTNVLRLNLVNGDSILYPSIITFSPTPTVTINELLVNTMTASVQGTPTRYSRT